MKKSRYSDSQILAILKQAKAGTPVPELCREHGISSATFYKWRARYGGMDASMMKPLKELEDENRRLKKMYAEERLKAALTHRLLGKWQSMAVPEQRYTSIPRGAYRTDPSPMQIVSGPYEREKVHYEAPSADRVPDEMTKLIDWYNQTSPVDGEQKIHALARAGIAHLWFEVYPPLR